MRIYMQRPAEDGGAPRFYHLFLEGDLFGGWSLVKEWGIQGASGRVQRQHFEEHEHAEKALQLARDNQLQRGYRVVFVQGQQLTES